MDEQINQILSTLSSERKRLEKEARVREKAVKRLETEIERCLDHYTLGNKRFERAVHKTFGKLNDFLWKYPEEEDFMLTLRLVEQHIPVVVTRDDSGITYIHFELFREENGRPKDIVAFPAWLDDDYIKQDSNGNRRDCDVMDQRTGYSSTTINWTIGSLQWGNMEIHQPRGRNRYGWGYRDLRGGRVRYRGLKFLKDGKIVPLNAQSFQGLEGLPMMKMSSGISDLPALSLFGMREAPDSATENWVKSLGREWGAFKEKIESAFKEYTCRVERIRGYDLVQYPFAEGGTDITDIFHQLALIPPVIPAIYLAARSITPQGSFPLSTPVTFAEEYMPSLTEILEDCKERTGAEWREAQERGNELEKVEFRNFAENHNLSFFWPIENAWESTVVTTNAIKRCLSQGFNTRFKGVRSPPYLLRAK